MEEAPSAQCKNSGGDSVVLVRLTVSCKFQFIGFSHDFPLHAYDQKNKKIFASSMHFSSFIVW